MTTNVVINTDEKNVNSTNTDSLLDKAEVKNPFEGIDLDSMRKFMESQKSEMIGVQNSEIPESDGLNGKQRRQRNQQMEKQMKAQMRLQREKNNKKAENMLKKAQLKALKAECQAKAALHADKLSEASNEAKASN